MKKILLFVSLFLMAFMAKAQTVLEDFEGGGQLTWTASNGTYNGIVDNPDVTGLNTSAKCGSYTKSGENEYSLFLTELSAPLDLSVNNELHIMVNSPVNTPFLVKLEGGGKSYEVRKYSAVKDKWIEYVCDFSSLKDATGITKIILFFDPGVKESADTYLFDNVTLYPQGACAGTAPDPSIFDDFECQRNASYGGGWDIIKSVVNPHSEGINTSAKVGEYLDPEDEWSALVIDNGGNNFDLSTMNQFKLKLWAPVTGKILMKLEGGTSPAKEIFLDVTQTNQWVEYTADFSDQKDALHKKFSLFFNAGVKAGPGEIYYVDDISRSAKTVAAIEDFENGGRQFWHPDNNDQVTHGTYNGIVANPDKSDINTSDNAGSYTKGASSFSTLVGDLTDPLDLSTDPQINMQVYAPAGSTKVKMQLVSLLEGIKEVERDITETGKWVEVNFDFSTYSDVTDFQTIKILFDQGVQSNLTYLFDNITQGKTSVDPCEGVVPNLLILDDYECQRNNQYVNGGNSLKVVKNPNINAGNPSQKVGEYTDPTDEWSALTLGYDDPIDLAVYNQLTVKILSAKIVPLKFKLEGGTSPAIEIDQTVEKTGDWVTYTVDFSSQIGQNHKKVSIFFNAGVAHSETDLYYIDDIQWKRAAYNGCASDYETSNTSISSFKYFANGHLETEGYAFKVVDNPLATGINPSQKVGEFIRASDGQVYAGMYGDLGARIDFKGNLSIKVKVLMDHIGNMGLKLEAPSDAWQSAEYKVANTKVNEWEELTFDLSAIDPTKNITRLTIFFDLGEAVTGSDVTSYFDDFVFGDGTCQIIATDNLTVQTLQLSPNPASESFTFKNNLDITRVIVTDLAGKPVKTIQVNANNQNIRLDGMNAGMYLVQGYNKTGLAAVGKLVKM